MRGSSTGPISLADDKQLFPLCSSNSRCVTPAATDSSTIIIIIIYL
jgi:hypothetical protein